MRVALFVTCFNDTLFPEPGGRRSRCWSVSGSRSSSPPEQTCCGQMHVNSGYEDEAGALARALRARVRGDEAVVSPIGVVRRRYVRERLRDGAGRVPRADASS